MGEQDSGAALSKEFGRVPLASFLAFWRDPRNPRFRYRPIRIVTLLVGVVLGALWALYLRQILTGGLSVPMVVFGLVLLLFTLASFARIMAWRLFVVRSAIVLSEEALLWRHGPDCFLAPWKLIEGQALGLGEAAFGKGYETWLNIRVRGHAERLYLVRLYARLDDRESFLAELFRRIPRGNWENP